MIINIYIYKHPFGYKPGTHKAHPIGFLRSLLETGRDYWESCIILHLHVMKRHASMNTIRFQTQKSVKLGFYPHIAHHLTYFSIYGLVVHNDNCRLHRWPSVLRLPRPVDVPWAACFMHEANSKEFTSSTYYVFCRQVKSYDVIYVLFLGMLMFSHWKLLWQKCLLSSLL